MLRLNIRQPTTRPTTNKAKRRSGLRPRSTACSNSSTRQSFVLRTRCSWSARSRSSPRISLRPRVTTRPVARCWSISVATPKPVARRSMTGSRRRQTSASSDRAVLVAKNSLDVAEKAVGPHHPSVATSLNNLAELYKTQGQYAQAESHAFVQSSDEIEWRTRRCSRRLCRMRAPKHSDHWTVAT